MLIIMVCKSPNIGLDNNSIYKEHTYNNYNVTYNTVLAMPTVNLIVWLIFICME